MQAAVARLFEPGVASVIVVGDAKRFLPELRKIYRVAEVIAADALTLDGAALK